MPTTTRVATAYSLSTLVLWCFGYAGSNMEIHYWTCFTYLQLNTSLLLSNLGPKARPETRTKNSKTRNPKKTENPRTVQTLLSRLFLLNVFVGWLVVSMTDAITQGAKMARDYWDQYICHNYSVLRKPQYKSTAKAGESEGQKWMAFTRPADRPARDDIRFIYSGKLYYSRLTLDKFPN